MGRVSYWWQLVAAAVIQPAFLLIARPANLNEQGKKIENEKNAHSKFIPFNPKVCRRCVAAAPPGKIK